MRRRRRAHAEDAVHHERWLVSYADFMTLMFALFVVLFAANYHDRKTLDQVSAAVKNGFQDLQVFSKDHEKQTASPNSLSSPSASKPQPTPPAQSGGIDTEELQRRLHTALGKEIERREVVLHMTPEGFVISLHELGFFDSGQAQLLPGAAEKVKRLAEVLMQYGLDMRVEGHSDNVPIHNAQFASNWELSTGRATAVAMMLLKDERFDPRRLSIAGYGEFHPTASNDTPEGRRENRRVDIVILSVDKQASAAGDH